MTDAELQGMCLQALNMAKKEMEQQGKFRGLLACYFNGKDEGLHRMSSVERLIAEKLGEDWLDHGARKDVGFRVIREGVGILRPDAMVWVAATNMFLPTEKLNQLGPEVAEGLSKGGHARHHEAVKEGLLSVHDAMVAIAQNPSRVCIYQQQYGRRDFVGRPEVQFFDQADFGGRMKLYGKPEPLGNIASKAHQ